MAEMANKSMNYKNVKLEGRTVLITGANTGIGKETVIDLAGRGATIIMGCRDMEKAEQAIKDIKSKDGLSTSNIVAYKLDLASLQSVREFAQEVLDKHDKIHILINNAGIMLCPEWKTKENFEMQFGVNHLGHFLLTNLLLERIKESAPSRVVVVSSVAHKYGKMNFTDLNMEKGYSSLKAYQQSKLANVLFAKHLAVLLKDSGVSVFSLHPGVIKTELDRHIGSTMGKAIGWLYTKVGPAFMKTPIQGAQTTIYCAVQEGIEPISGSYFSDCKVATPSTAANNMADAEKLWEVSKTMVNLEN